MSLSGENVLVSLSRGGFLGTCECTDQSWIWDGIRWWVDLMASLLPWAVPWPRWCFAGHLCSRSRVCHLSARCQSRGKGESCVEFFVWLVFLLSLELRCYVSSGHALLIPVELHIPSLAECWWPSSAKRRAFHQMDIDAESSWALELVFAVLCMAKTSVRLQVSLPLTLSTSPALKKHVK